ncbi:MAG: RecX family transcriptional regulator [Bacteroidota bacterium]|nr:RecX family transcriptional regulator [Bacteroidota bacterium]
MIITKIEQQKRHPDRVNIYLDGEFAFGLHKEVIQKFGLRKGDELPSEIIDKLNSTEELTLAKQKALRFLSYRMRSEKEIRAKLIEKEFQTKTVDEVIKNLHSLGLINDLEFARAFVHDLLLRKPAGQRLIRQKLHLKGIQPSIIQNILEKELIDNEQDLALQAARKQMQRYKAVKKKTDEKKIQQRVAQHLARRGFGWSVISSVLKKVFKDIQTMEDEI